MIHPWRCGGVINRVMWTKIAFRFQIGLFFFKDWNQSLKCELRGFYMTTAVCVWREKAWVGRVSALWWGPLTMPPFHRWAVHRARPTSCPSLPVQLHSLPDPSVWCEWYGREWGREGSPPLMFSLGTGCCLFDFQWKQRQHLQFEQIVQCCPAVQRTSAKEDRTSTARKDVCATYIHVQPPPINLWQICTPGLS